MKSQLIKSNQRMKLEEKIKIIEYLERWKREEFNASNLASIGVLMRQIKKKNDYDPIHALNLTLNSP